jgi:AbrB family looped-hinge helix DNA binding protein
MSTITSKGQVTLPKPLRDRMGLKPGSQVDFQINADGDVVVKSATKAKRKTSKEAASAYRTILESLRGTADKRFATTDEYMKFIRG